MKPVLLASNVIRPECRTELLVETEKCRCLHCKKINKRFSQFIIHFPNPKGRVVPLLCSPQRYMKSISLAVVDKRPIIRVGLVLHLKEKFLDADVTQFKDLVSFTAHYPSQQPDAVLIATGIDEHREHLDAQDLLRGKGKTGPVIIYDENPKSRSIINFLEQGTRGYISAADDMDELLICITEVIKGNLYVSQPIFQFVMHEQFTTVSDRKRNKSKLSPGERQVFDHLAKGTKTSVIATRLGKKISTISTIKSNIFRKLGVSNIIDLNRAFSETSSDS